MGNDYNDCVLTYGKLTLAYQTGTYANFGVTMTSQNTSLIILMVGFAVGRAILPMRNAKKGLADFL